MRRFRETFPNSDRTLLYGTDWSMIGHEDKFITKTESLPDVVAKFQCRTFSGTTKCRQRKFDARPVGAILPDAS